jgi:hypothetical protein
VQRRRQLRVRHDERHLRCRRDGRRTFGTGSQVVGDKVFIRKAGARLWQLFRNDGGTLDDTELLAPPEHPFATPVIPGTCDDACQPDVTMLEAACGFPVVFPCAIRRGRYGRSRTRTASSTRCRATASATSRRERTGVCAS